MEGRVNTGGKHRMVLRKQGKEKTTQAEAWFPMCVLSDSLPYRQPKLLEIHKPGQLEVDAQGRFGSLQHVIILLYEDSGQPFTRVAQL